MTDSIEELKQQRDTDGIMAALGNESAEVRLAAAQALGDMLALRAIDSLSAALQDSSPAVRQASARALGKIGDHRTAMALVAALKDDDSEVRQAVVQSLGQMGGIRVVRPLVGALKDGDSGVQAAAKVALRAKAASALRSRWTWIILVAVIALAVVIVRSLPPRPVGPLATLTKGSDTWELLGTETTQTIPTGGLSDFKAPPGQVLLQVHFKCVTHNVLEPGSPVYVVDSQGSKYSIAYFQFSIPSEKNVPETLTLTYSVPNDRSGFQLLFFDLPPVGLGR